MCEGVATDHGFDITPSSCSLLFSHQYREVLDEIFTKVVLDELVFCRKGESSGFHGFRGSGVCGQGLGLSYCKCIGMKVHLGLNKWFLMKIFALKSDSSNFDESAPNPLGTLKSGFEVWFGKKEKDKKKCRKRQCEEGWRWWGGEEH